MFVKQQGVGQAMGRTAARVGGGTVEEREQIRVGATRALEAWAAGLTAERASCFRGGQLYLIHEPVFC